MTIVYFKMKSTRWGHAPFCLIALEIIGGRQFYPSRSSMESGSCQIVLKLCSLDVSSNASHHTFSPHKYCNHFVTVTLKKRQTKPNKNKSSKSPEIRNRKGKALSVKAFPWSSEIAFFGLKIPVSAVRFRLSASGQSRVYGFSSRKPFFWPSKASFVPTFNFFGIHPHMRSLKFETLAASDSVFPRL